jgi:hypothetical protein
MPTLRTPNNPVTSAVLLAALQSVIPAGTALTTANPADPTGLSVIYIRSRYQMATAGLFPAVNLSTGVQKFQRTSQRAYAGGVVVNISYYNRWDQNNVQTQEEIVVAMEADLERIRANLETMESLPINGSYTTISIPAFSVSPDKGELDSTFPGPPLLYRTLMASCNILEYGC